MLSAICWSVLQCRAYLLGTLQRSGVEDNQNRRTAAPKSKKAENMSSARIRVLKTARATASKTVQRTMGMTMPVRDGRPFRGDSRRVGELDALHFRGTGFASVTTAARHECAPLPKPSEPPQFWADTKRRIPVVKKAVSDGCFQ